MIDKTVNPKTAEMMDNIAPTIQELKKQVQAEACSKCSYNVMGNCILQTVGHKCLFVARRNV